MIETQDHNSKFKRILSGISGENGEPSPTGFEQAVIELSELASSYPAAKAKLAVFKRMKIGTRESSADTDKLFLDAAMTGFPPLVRDLGIHVSISGNDDGMGAGLLCRAASAGDWIAGFLILREACRGRYFLSAKNLKGLAAQLTDAVPFKSDIQTEMAALNDDIPVLSKAGFSVEICKGAIAHKKSTDIKRVALHDKDPNVQSLEKILSPIECDYLIAMSCSTMKSSKVVSAKVGESVSAGYRTSDGTVLLPHMMEYPAVHIVEKLSAASGISPQNGEFLSLLRYMPGQEYLPHHDFLEEDKNDYSMVNRCGQRCATLLTYLNDGYEGGETAFPKLDITYKGQAGDSLYFKNTDEQGSPIQNSLHAGLPVTSGEKWLATLWVREKPFWPWMR